MSNQPTEAKPVNVGIGTSDLFGEVRAQLRIQGEHGNWNCNSYMHGMYNGLECALSTLEKREPQFRTAPKQWLDDIPKPEGRTPTVACEPNKQVSHGSAANNSKS